MKVAQTRDELFAHLREQLHFLETSAHSYDQGFEGEAKRIAVVLRVAQYGGARPLAVRLAPQRSLHDRAIFIDCSTAWTITQSLRDFAKRSPAEIIRADDTADLKIAAYEALWASAAIVV